MCLTIIELGYQAFAHFPDINDKLPGGDNHTENLEFSFDRLQVLLSKMGGRFCSNEFNRLIRAHPLIVLQMGTL